MGYCRQTALPETEPVQLSLARAYLRLPRSFTSEDVLINELIQAAREEGERLSKRALARRTFVQVMDSQTADAPQAYPAEFYCLPQWSTSLWNDAQKIELGYSPVISVQRMRIVQPDGTIAELLPDVDFVLDRISEPARLFPIPGKYWPATLRVANAVQIDFTAGYDADPAAVDTQSPLEFGQPASTVVTGRPSWVVDGILNLVMFWWNNRGQGRSVPDDIGKVFLQHELQKW